MMVWHHLSLDMVQKFQVIPLSKWGGKKQKVINKPKLALKRILK